MQQVLYNVNPKRSPLAFSGVQSELAVVYIRRISGRHDENLEAAISALERSSAALSGELTRRKANEKYLQRIRRSIMVMSAMFDWWRCPIFGQCD